MLKILVCVKQVPDLNLVKMDPATGNLVRAGVPTLLNPLDANALEAAVLTKEKYGGEVTVITMGPPVAESTLRECIAVGADKAVLITGRPFGGADTLSTSYAIKMAADMEDRYDLIFAGKESADGATGQMGPQLAERFGTSQIMGAVMIDAVDEAERKITARKEAEGGTETIEAKLPCLLTVDKANYPARLPTLTRKLLAKRASVTVYTENNIDGLDPDKIGVPGSGTIVPEIYPPVLPEAGQIIDEGCHAASVSRLVDILGEIGVLFGGLTNE